MRTTVESPVEEALPAKAKGCFAGLCGNGVQGTASVGTDHAQAEWAARRVRDRLKVLRRARHLMAERAEVFAEAISPKLARNRADTLGSEVLPLLDACKFLEHNAERLLKPRRLGLSGRPLWLSGVRAEVHREPLGHVLVIGPSNFPLLLTGVQTLQALTAGNSVTWKPGAGGAAVAAIFAEAMQAAGLPAGLLTVTDESVEAAERALADGPDKVVFTGSSRSGQAVLARLAATATPAVVELSGADAVVVTPKADLKLVAKAVAFGLRLNGGAVCMSPRRLFATAATMRALRPLLETELSQVPPVSLDEATGERLRAMLDEAVSAGAEVWQGGQGSLTPTSQNRDPFDFAQGRLGHPASVQPVLVDRATPGMTIARSDIFAPVLSLIEAETMLHVPELYAQCPYALTLAVFCHRSEVAKARTAARTLKAGMVIVNDVIASSVDPRVPFGGRGASGYGVTRGAEGLLEMTAVKTLLLRHGNYVHLDATTEADVPIFSGLIGAVHGRGWQKRLAAVRELARGVRRRLGSRTA